MSLTGIFLVTFGLIQQSGWSPLFSSVEASRHAEQIEVTPEGEVLVGGRKSGAYQWNGESWTPRTELGTVVSRIMVTGSGDVTFVNSPHDGIRRWTGNSAIRLGPDERINPGLLTAGSDGSLFVADGSPGFSGNGLVGTGVLRYDGVWSVVGNFEYVSGLAVTPDGTVYAHGAVGAFTEPFIGELKPGETSFRRIAAEGLDVDLASDGDGRIYALVEFGGEGELEQKGIHVYEAGNWQYAGFPDATVLRSTPGGHILINERRGGSNFISRVDESGSVAERSGMIPGAVFDIAFHPQSADFLAVGRLRPFESGIEYDVVRWTKEAWSVLGPDLPRLGSVKRVDWLERLDSGEIWAVGDFGAENPDRDIDIAEWTGDSWNIVTHPFTGDPGITAGRDGRIYAFGSIPGTGSESQIRVYAPQGWEEVFPSIQIPEAEGGITGIQALDVAGDGRSVAAGTFSMERFGYRYAWVAEWDGSNWTLLGTGDRNSRVVAILRDGSDIVVGGSFSSFGGVEAANIARWNGTEWAAIGPGLSWSPAIDHGVWDLDLFNGQIVAGGIFVDSGSEHVAHIAVWDGDKWYSPDGGVNAGVSDVSVLDDTLMYVGGDFQWAGMREVNNVAVWDGHTWADLDGGTDARVQRVVPVTSDSVWAAGQFTVAGGKSSDGIGVWKGLNHAGSDADDPVDIPDESVTGDIRAGIYPNPAADLVTIYASGREAAHWRGTVHDLIGRVIGRLRESTFEESAEWELNVSEWPAGVYFVRVEGAGRSALLRIVVAR